MSLRNLRYLMLAAALFAAAPARAADSTVTALPAASALGDADLFYTVQGGNSRKATGLQISTYIATKPVLCANLPAFTGDVTNSLCAMTLAASGVTAASYGSATQVPQITIDAKGRITVAGNVTITPAFSSLTGSLACSQTPALTGDVTTSAGSCGTSYANNVPATKGGTGVASPTAHAVAIAEGASAFNFATIGTAGRLFIDQGAAADPAFEALSGDATITSAGVLTIGNGAVTNAKLANSSITLNAGTGVGLTAPGAMSLGSTYTFGATSDTPRFAGLGLGGAANTRALRIYGSTSGSLDVDVAAVAGTGSKITFPGGTTDFSATGAAHNFVKQSSSGAALTIGQPACADLSDASVFCNGTSAASLTGSAPVGVLGASAASHGALIDVAGTATWKVVPDCTDTGGNHLNYTQATDAFSCGTTGGAGGGVTSVATSNGITGGTITTTGTLKALGVGRPQGRLTLVTGTPVMISTQSAKTTIFYTPYAGTHFPLYDGTSTVMTDTGGELSIVMGSNWAASSLFDAFLGNDSGTIRLCTGPAWTSTTARGTGAGTTELEYKNGFLANKNSMTCRYNNTTTITCAVDQCTYVGTFATNGSTGTTEFIFGASAAGGTAGSFLVWNMYNRVPINSGLVNDSTTAYSYATASWRQADASTGMQVVYVVGQIEDPVRCRYTTTMPAGTGANGGWACGVDSTTTPSGLSVQSSSNQTNNSTAAFYAGYPGVGQHKITALEFGRTSGTFNGAVLIASTTWTGLMVDLRM